MKGPKNDKTIKHVLGANYTLPRIPTEKLVDEDAKVEAIVRFIARRAAERDYAELLRAIENRDNPDNTEET